MALIPAIDPALAALVVKDGVALGGLPEPQRQLALAWAGLPCTALTEPEVNQRLQALLAAALRCLETDHVELRRQAWVARGNPAPPTPSSP